MNCLNTRHKNQLSCSYGKAQIFVHAGSFGIQRSIDIKRKNVSHYFYQNIINNDIHVVFTRMHCYRNSRYTRKHGDSNQLGYQGYRTSNVGYDVECQLMFIFNLDKIQKGFILYLCCNYNETRNLHFSIYSGQITCTNFGTLEILHSMSMILITCKRKISA